MSRTSAIYDALFAAESARHAAPYPVHKKLNFHGKYDDLADWILDNVPIKKGETLLDAGCGTGNTLFKLARAHDISGMGVSVSEKEVAFATDWTTKQGLGDRLSFSVKSYDDTFEQRFDKIIAIEALKHSNDLPQTVKNLANHLTPNGVFIFADDFLFSASNTSERQKRYWNAPSFVDLMEFLALLEEMGFGEVQTIDLTNRMTQRPPWKIQAGISSLQLLKLLRTGDRKRQAEIYLGGLLLERLYARGEATYQLIMASK